MAGNKVTAQMLSLASQPTRSNLTTRPGPHQPQHLHKAFHAQAEGLFYVLLFGLHFFPPKTQQSLSLFKTSQLIALSRTRATSLNCRRWASTTSGRQVSARVRTTAGRPSRPARLSTNSLKHRPGARQVCRSSPGRSTTALPWSFPVEKRFLE